jgi:hypothetical protein
MATYRHRNMASPPGFSIASAYSLNSVSFDTTQAGACQQIMENQPPGLTRTTPKGPIGQSRQGPSNAPYHLH